MDANAFYLEQYKMLREEIIFSMGQLYSTETYAAIAVVVAYVLLLLNTHRLGTRSIWFIPPLLILVSGVHCLILALRISSIGNYLMRIEEIALPQGGILPGWEHYKLDHYAIDRIDFVLAILAWTLSFVVSLAI